MLENIIIHIIGLPVLIIKMISPLIIPSVFIFVIYKLAKKLIKYNAEEQAKANRKKDEEP